MLGTEQQIGMDKLKGSGSTFSTSGKAWKPFETNPKVLRQNAKRWRLKRAGLAGSESKDELRKLAEMAVSGALPNTKPSR